MLYLDGKPVGKGRIDRTAPIIFSLDDKTDVGTDVGSLVSDDYEPGDPAFSGQIDWVQIDLLEDGKTASHLITGDDLWRVAVARQ